MQILEGDEMSVSSLYSKVKRDKRHDGCMILSARQGQKREFSDWFMGYKNVSGHSGAKTLFNLNKETLSKILPEFPSVELGTLTNTYAKVSGL